MDFRNKLKLPAFKQPIIIDDNDIFLIILICCIFSLAW